MGTVFDTLKAMGKATSIELAARLDISREEVLNELWELKKADFVDKGTYAWRAADNNVQREQPVQAELSEEIATAAVAKISECDLTATIEQRGPQTADELATLFGTTSRKVTSTLAMAIDKGRLIRINQGGKFRYCIPGDSLPAEPKVTSVFPLWLSASSSACHGVLIITVITPPPIKNSATKVPGNWGWRTRRLLRCRCISVVLLRSMQNA